MAEARTTVTRPIIPVVLSGGVGSRLWPLSRSQRPKQFLRLQAERTLFQETLSRVGDTPFAPAWIVCNQEHRFLVAEQFRELGRAPGRIILEPVGRSTAPAITAAAILAHHEDADAVLMVLPSDHAIRNTDGFREAVAIADKAVAKGVLVAFGIEPTFPATGYGYVHQGDPIAGVEGCYRVQRFVEKPDADTAKAFLREGRYTWNSGMFMFSAARYLEDLGRFHPEIVNACRRSVTEGAGDLDFFRLGEDAFAKTTSVSIDYAMMEKTDSAAVVPAEMGWSDVGAWTALLEAGDADADGNVLVGDAMVDDVRGSYVRSDKPLVAVIGVEDMIVVATDDAVLIVPKDRAQDVRAIADRLEAEGRTEAETSTRVYRPWGYYQIIDKGERFQAKQLMLTPGAKLSLQRHNHRAEHWVVVEGTATVTRGEETFALQANESTYIPVGIDHRLENATDEPLRLIEVQSGDYLGEDDIVRLEDLYGRN